MRCHMTIYKDNAKIFKAFCDEKRLKIIELLTNGEKCACVLLENLDLTQSGLSYHMKILIDSGVIISRQDGRWTYYQISETGKNNAIKQLIAITKNK
ncbi:metalloregulator ArsR/SmtB family transcription factor [Fusobacterium sp.]|uniref:ArsR/SmtB family transcription factor n=2 Tax=Fusobacterium TaxID=848 RepID=UPI0025BE8083|nr:metalloregulator ArsR/SmtB family transcription factor [Fusobacterium sp.]MCI7223174.1 metalloregulator ArsR/SmtB family transcription factor [Fusobacterium sp.]